jgi:excisionase family DNA binding protein
MLTVPDAARRTGRTPETIRRCIREGKVAARKVGTRHVIEESDRDAYLGASPDTMTLPAEWRTTFWGGPMPNWTSIPPPAGPALLIITGSNAEIIGRPLIPPGP